MEPTKKKITRIVKHYIKYFPEEFELFKEGMEAKRHMTHDEFATLEGSSVSRGLYEMPETLSQMFITGLDEDDMVWLKAGGKDGHEGGRWFATTFPVFKLPEKI